MLENDRSCKINGIEIKKPPVKYVEKMEKEYNLAVQQRNYEKRDSLDLDALDSPEKPVKFEMRQ